MSKIDLLPCPFCGSDNITIIKSKSIDGLFAAECIKCNASTAFYVNEKFAAETWNNRAPGWIPCIERMPEKDGDYLCISNNEYKILPYRNGEFYSTCFDAVLRCCNSSVTHWMPFPPKPEVINNVD